VKIDTRFRWPTSLAIRDTKRSGLAEPSVQTQAVRNAVACISESRAGGRDIMTTA
jgi:hypothetical protein